MTDAERIEKMNKTRDRLWTEIFGADVVKASSSVPEVELRTTDKNWNTQRSWMDRIRITSPMNSDMRSIGEINQQLHDNHGVIVTVMTEKPGFAIDPIK